MNAIELQTPPAQATTARAAAPACLLVNPRSHSIAGGRLAARAIALAKRHGVDAIEAGEPAEIAAALDAMLGRGARRLFVLAGDGSVQAIADHLARLPAGVPVPQMLLLAGGRTNLIAADLGSRGDPFRTLESALVRSAADAGGGFRVRRCNTLVIEQVPAPPRHGFFLAAAQVDALIRHCHRYRESGGGRLRAGRMGTVWCLLGAAIPAIRSRAPFECPDLDVALTGCGRLRGPTRFLIATTLAHVGRRFNPYADRGEGELRVTAVAAGARGFWRSLPRLLEGRFTPAMDIDHGYLSGRTGQLTVQGLEAYTLDGQSFPADPARQVTIRRGPGIDFLMP